MDCQKCQELIPRALDGELSEQEQEKFAEYLEICGDCRSEYKQMKSILQTVGSLPDRNVPPGFRDKWKKALEQEQAKEKVSTPPRWRSWVSLGVGLAAAVLIMIAAPNMFPMGRSEQSDSAAPTESIESAPADEEAGEFSIQAVGEPEAMDKNCSEAIRQSPEQFDLVLAWQESVESSVVEYMKENRFDYDPYDERDHVYCLYVEVEKWEELLAWIEEKGYPIMDRLEANKNNAPYIIAFE